MGASPAETMAGLALLLVLPPVELDPLPPPHAAVKATPVTRAAKVRNRERCHIIRPPCRLSCRERSCRAPPGSRWEIPSGTGCNPGSGAREARQLPFWDVRRLWDELRTLSRWWLATLSLEGGLQPGRRRWMRASAWRRPPEEEFFT